MTALRPVWYRRADFSDRERRSALEPAMRGLLTTALWSATSLSGGLHETFTFFRLVVSAKFARFDSKRLAGFFGFAPVGQLPPPRRPGCFLEQNNIVMRLSDLLSFP